MTINIPLQIKTDGGQQAVQDFEAIRRAIEKTAKESSGITGLASSLGKTYKEAKQLSQTLNLTAEQTGEAVAILKQLSGVGADSATKFQVLAGKLGITIDQFEALNAAMVGQKQSIAQSVAEYSSLAKSIGSSYDEAQAFAKELGLTAQQAQQAVSQLRDLNSVGGSTSLKYQVLEDTLGVTADQFDKLEAAARGAKGEVAEAGQGAGGFNNVLQGIGQGIGQAGFGMLTNILSQLPGQIAGPTLQFEKFKTVLKTLYGDADKADEAFNQIQQFAATTPFQLDEVLGSFIALKNRGIEPTQDLLRNMGDIAASQGKSLNQFTEAILDATTGEYERLKEFGVQASAAGDKVTFAFKGVSKTIEKTPEAIQSAIQSFGQLQGVAGGMEAQSKTLGGSLSNLQDNATKIAVAFGEELIPVLVEFVTGATSGTASMEEFAKELGQNVASVLKTLAGALKFANENAAVFQSLLAVIAAQMAAVRAVALYQTLLQIAAGMTGAAAGTASFSTVLGAASIAMKSFLASAIALAPALVALGAAVALIALVKMTADLKAANEELDAMAELTTASSNEFAQIGGKVKGLNDVYKQNGTLNAEQQKQARGYVQISRDKIKALDEEIARAKAIAPANEEQRNAQAALIAGLERQRSALESQTATLEENLEGIKKRTKGIQSATDAEKELKKITEGVKSGSVSEDAALSQLEAIKNNAKAGKEIQKVAANEILAIRKNQTDAEVALLDASKAAIETRVKQGTLSEAAAQKELTAITQQEIQKRLELNRQQQATATGSQKQNLVAEERQLQAQLAQAEAEAEDARNAQLLENFDERKSILEGQYAQGKVTKEQYNKQLLDLDLKQNDEELRQLQESLKQLSAADTEGREAINAKIGEVMSKRADITRQAYARETETIAEANDKALSQSKLVETERQIEIAKLEKSGAISAEEAEKLKLEATLKRIDQEIAAEQEKYAKLQALQTKNPEDEEKRQKDLRSSQQAIASLTLQRIQSNRQAEDSIQKKATASIEQRQKKEELANRKSALATQLKIDALDRQKQAQELIVKSIEREGKLLESAANVQRARANAESSRLDGQADSVNKVLELVRQTNEETDPKKKAQQQQILQALGIDANLKEIDLIKQKQEIEDAQARAKFAALRTEQELARQQLELNIRRSESEARILVLVARRAKLEAETASGKAELEALKAKGEIEKAQLIKDPKAKAAALKAANLNAKQANREASLASSQGRLANEQLEQAEQGVEDARTMGDQQREALAIQQQSSEEVFRQQEGVRQLGQVMELAKLGAEGFAAAMEKAAAAGGTIRQALGGAIPQSRFKGGEVRAGKPYLVGEEGPELITPNRSGWVFTARQTAKILADVQPLNPFNLSSGTVAQIASLQRDGAILDELKTLRAKVERVGDATYKLAYTPRSLTIPASEDPTTTAIQYERRLQRLRLRGSGK